MDGAATDGDDLIRLLPIVLTGLANLLLEDVIVRMRLVIRRSQVACNVQRLRLITSQNTDPNDNLRIRSIHWLTINSRGPKKEE